jgi:hypothetical protein
MCLVPQSGRWLRGWSYLDPAPAVLEAMLAGWER